MVETDSHYEEASPAAAQHHHQTYFHIEHGKSESRLQLQRLVASWAEGRPDVCLLSSDNQRVFSHRSLLSLHSRTLFSVLHTHTHHLHDELPILSVPAPGRALRCLLRLLTAGVVVAHSKEDLREAERAAAVLGVSLHNTVTQRIKIPSSEMLSYNKQPVMSKFIGIKPNIIDICDPCTDNADILDVLDEEIEAGENAVNSSSDIQLLPSAKKFKSKMFTERLQKLKDSGTDFQIMHQSKPEYPSYIEPDSMESVQTYAPSSSRHLSFDCDDVVSNSDSSTTLSERKSHKRKLYAEEGAPRELSDEEDKVEFSRDQCGSCNLNSSWTWTTGSPKAPKSSTQRQLYNSCDDCIKKRAEDNIKALKQKKYFQMLKEKSAEKMKGEKYPCDKCKYVAANSSNLKTHKLANHDGVDFVNNYVNDYFQKNKFLIL